MTAFDDSNQHSLVTQAMHIGSNVFDEIFHPPHDASAQRSGTSAAAMIVNTEQHGNSRAVQDQDAIKIQTDADCAMGSGKFKNADESERKQALQALRQDSTFLYAEPESARSVIQSDLTSMEKAHDLPHLTITGDGSIHGTCDVGDNGVYLSASPQSASAVTSPGGFFNTLFDSSSSISVQERQEWR